MQNVALRHLALELLPEKEKLTERRRARRGEDMLFFSHARDVFLQDVTLRATDAVRAAWRDVLRAEDCEGLEGCVRGTFCKKFP